MVKTFALVAALVEVLAASSAAAQAPRSAACTEWRQCRQMALEAAERRDYETFHDLAWRTIQTGNAKDPALMYLLARAQSLSGRPHDALVMLQRLADMGVATDAAANDDFKRTRELAGWPELAAQFERIEHPDVATAVSPAPAANSSPRSPAAATPPAAPASRPAAPPPAPSVSRSAAPPPAPSASRPAAPAPAPSASGPIAPPPPAPEPAAVVPPPAPTPAPGTRPADPAPAPVAAPPVLNPARVSEAIRLSTASFTVGGLAYDAVSRRFLFGDRLGHKLVVASEGSTQTSDLVRDDSAGFREISAIEIDPKRGDLWVLTAAAGGGGGTLHRLQLVSGRPLRAFPVDDASGPVTLVDLAVTPTGTVLVLDSASRQLLALRPGVAALERVVQLGADEPVSVATVDRDDIAYVAHRDGISRIDLKARTATALSVAKGTSIGHLERIRWHRNSLIALTIGADGTRTVVRLELNGRGDAITRATTLGASVPNGAETFVAIAGDDLIYMESGARDSVVPTELVAYRVRLR